MNRSQFFVSFIVACISLPVMAADYPSKPIRLLVPSAPGSTNDASARIFSDNVGGRLGQSIIIENRPGANDIVAMNVVLQAEPDGSTLLWTSSGFPALPVISKAATREFMQAFTPVSMVVAAPTVIMASITAPFKNLDEMIAFMNENPGKVNYAVGGAGASHLLATWFAVGSKTKFTLIPYAGGAQATTALMTGESDFFLQVVGPALAAASTGKIRLIGFPGVSRHPKLPNVTAFGESKYSDLRDLARSGFGGTVWFGVQAPSKAPRLVVTTLSSAISEAAKNPDFLARVEKLNMDLVASKPDEFAATIARETEIWKNVAKVAGMEPQ